MKVISPFGPKIGKFKLSSQVVKKSIKKLIELLKKVTL